MSRPITLLKKTATQWVSDKAPRLGAALAYYTIFSIAPLVIISITITGLLFDHARAQEQILGQIQSILGEKGAEAIRAMIEAAQKPVTSTVATALGLLTLLFGAAGVFIQLKDALNTIWNVKPREGGGLWGFVRNYFLSFSMVLGIGFLLLVSLLLAAGMAAVGEYFKGMFPGFDVLMKIAGMAISFLLVSLLFALMFKFLPDIKVSWHDVWLGAVLTSALFVVGKFALGAYFGKAKIGSAYGAAGSLVLVLLWIYYSAQILFFGAEFTQVYANYCGSRAGDNPDSLLPKGKKLRSKKERLVAQNEHRRHELSLICRKTLGWQPANPRVLQPTTKRY